MLRKYEVLEDTLVLDKGNQYEGSYRFEEVDALYKNTNNYTILPFKQGEIVSGATRTEIGQWLLRRDKLKEITK